MSLIILYLIFAMLTTLWLDVTRYTIPNWLVVSLLALYPVAVQLNPHPIDWQMALAGMAIVFAVGFFVFSLRFMGGGDIKLITVLALWVGWEKLADFAILFALIGGVFSLVVFILRKLQPYLPWKQKFKTPKLLQKDAPIPYGVAIASAFLWMMHQQEITILLVAR